MKKIFICLAIAVLTFANVQSALAVDLVTVYEDAVTADPTLKEAAANRLATLESKPQALAALLPQVDGQYTRSESWNSGSSTFNQALQDTHRT